MQLQTRTLDTPQQAVIVSLTTDRLDAGNVSDFRAALQPIAEAHDIVMLDMQRLTFVDSSGLGALLSCLRVMNGRRGQLILFGMTKPVRALFELVRMHRIFSIYASEEEALGQLKAA